MKVLILQDDLFGYLQYVVRSYASGGIDPEEGMALFQLHQALKGVQTVDENQVPKVSTAEANDVQMTDSEESGVLNRQGLRP